MQEAAVFQLQKFLTPDFNKQHSLFTDDEPESSTKDLLEDRSKKLQSHIRVFSRNIILSISEEFFADNYKKRPNGE